MARTVALPQRIRAIVLVPHPDGFKSQPATAIDIGARGAALEVTRETIRGIPQGSCIPVVFRPLSDPLLLLVRRGADRGGPTPVMEVTFVDPGLALAGRLSPGA